MWYLCFKSEFTKKSNKFAYFPITPIVYNCVESELKENCLFKKKYVQSYFHCSLLWLFHNMNLSKKLKNIMIRLRYIVMVNFDQ